MFKRLILPLTLLLAACSPLPPPDPEAPAPCLPKGWCYVDAVVPLVRSQPVAGGYDALERRVKVDLKYAGSDNFVGRPIAGYNGYRAILRRDAAEALGHAVADLEKQGYGLIIWDAYRPTSAMKDFYEWSFTADERMRARFYPNITKRGIYEGRYIGRTSEHTWGVAVDVTLFHLKDGREVDMGGHHDLLDPSSATYYEGITPQQQANRRLLCETMARAGFRNYSKEWWHYFLRDSGPWEAYGFPLHDALQPYPEQ